MDKNKIKITPLEFALDFEVKGTQLYLNLAIKTKNVLGKKLFFSLAHEEMNHAEKVDLICSDIIETTGWNILNDIKLPTVQDELKSFFLKADKTVLKENAQDLSGYDIAMEMERTGYKTYKGFLNEAIAESEKEFFKQLLKQESEHLEALANVYKYFTGTGDWLQEEESKVWNWMNI